MTQLSDIQFDKIGIRRDHEDGWYEGHFVGYEFGEYRRAGEGEVADLDLLFHAETPLGDMNMEHVNTDRKLRKRIGVWKDSDYAPIYEALSKIDPDVAVPGTSGGASLPSILDSLVSKPVKVRVGPDPYTLKKKNVRFPVIVNVEPLA